jgi:hypothetical protein
VEGHADEAIVAPAGSAHDADKNDEPSLRVAVPERLDGEDRRGASIDDARRSISRFCAS